MENSDLLLTLALVLFAAKAGGLACRRVGLPSVFGSLAMGLALGPAALGVLHLDESLNAVGDLGVILLMFIAGLETDVVQMRRVGAAALLAACGGVALPLAAGTALGYAFGMGHAEAFFLGTVLTATSVGISAQTLQELGKLQSREGSAILAAAVIDDVLGVVALSLVLGFTGGDNPALPLAKMALFIPVAIAAGVFLVPIVIERILHLHDGETRTAIVIAMALLFAWSSEHWGGLAAISGAYLAGLMVARTEIGEHMADATGRMAYAFFVPVFFVAVGLKMDAGSLGQAPVLAAAVVATAIVTKFLGSMAGSLGGGFSRVEATRVGFGMVSRGEVALVVAVVGLDRGVLSESTFSATILMTLVTTLVAPLLLKWSYRPQASGVPLRVSQPVGASGAPVLAAEYDS